jgi:hypothetical protein
MTERFSEGVVGEIVSRDGTHPLPTFSQVLILEEVESLHFDTLSEVFILNSLFVEEMCNAPKFYSQGKHGNL